MEMKCHHCLAVECEREVTLASGEENEVGEGAVMAVKRWVREKVYVISPAKMAAVAMAFSDNGGKKTGDMEMVLSFDSDCGLGEVEESLRYYIGRSWLNVPSVLGLDSTVIAQI
ncbi:hypothetical protein H5410_032364 [Solanum commersonii]|uniref:Uncharacterized protein n=1 Tax=Solanum commersonii TaxID=4109 RepID=A0A9J5YKT8_SOLCO|nr:hypothetical protein H5410_032364 [Solanum commersonii]